MSLNAALTFDDLNYAPPTPYELELMAVDRALSEQMRAAIDVGDAQYCADLLDEKSANERRFQASRAHTWHVWMESEFPAAMAQYAGRRTA